MGADWFSNRGWKELWDPANDRARWIAALLVSLIVSMIIFLNGSIELLMRTKLSRVPAASAYDRVCGAGVQEIADASGVALSETEAERRLGELLEASPAKSGLLDGETTAQTELKEAFVTAKAALLRAIENRTRSSDELQAASVEINTTLIAFEDANAPVSAGVRFERLSNQTARVVVGRAFVLPQRSRWSALFTFAHELGHALPPATQEKGCPKSATALKLTADQQSEACADGWATQAVAWELQKAFVAKAASGRAPASIEAAPGAQSAARAAVFDLCLKHAGPTSTHPSPQFRIGAIYGLNPVVRDALGLER